MSLLAARGDAFRGRNELRDGFPSVVNSPSMPQTSQWIFAALKLLAPIRGPPP